MSLTNIEKLLKLQETDRRIQQFAIEAKDIPRRRKKILSKLDAQQAIVDAAHERHQKIQIAIKEIEMDVQLSRDKVSRYRRQQMEVNDNESYRALDNEIRGLTRHVERQDERGIKLVIDDEEAEENLKQQTQVLEEQKVAVAEEEAKLIQLEAEVETSRTEAGEGRDGLTEGIDPEWLSRYERTFKHTGNFALVTSNGGKCGGCNMKLPPAVVLASKKMEAVSTCNYCGRMLYFKV